MGLTTDILIYDIILPSIGNTLIIMAWAFLFSSVVGFLIALALVTTYPQGLRPMPVVYRIIDMLVNMVRSIPFIILIVSLMPVMRFIFGSAIGIPAATFAISVHGAATVARLLESSFREADPQLIEAARSFGAPNWRILKTVVVGETLPSVVTNLTYVSIMIMSCTAMAGVVGAGGVGAVAISYGYRQFNDAVMYSCLVILLIIAVILQLIGNRIYLKVK